MNVFKAEIANYFGGGSSRTDYDDGGWSLNVIELKLGHYKARIVQGRDIISNNIQPKGLVYTSDIEIVGIKKYEEGERVVNDICRLLSLASFSQVVPLSYSYDGRGRRPTISAEAMNYRPLINIKSGKTTKSYLEKTWTCYRKKKRSRKIAEVIEMLTTAELPIQPLEVKLAQVFIIFENLKGTFAKSQGIPFSRGFFRNVNNGKRYSFEDLLKLMFHDAGMNPSLRRIIKLRNEIIHFGLSRKPYSSLTKHYDNSQDLIREYLLRLLEFEGQYLLYSAASRATREM